MYPYIGLILSNQLPLINGQQYSNTVEKWPSHINALNHKETYKQRLLQFNL